MHQTVCYKRASLSSVRPAGSSVRPSSRVCIPRAGLGAQSKPKGGDGGNPYHDRDHTRTQNPGGALDANAREADKDAQYEYQQERLEWRRKNQGEGQEDRDDGPRINWPKKETTGQSPEMRVKNANRSGNPPPSDSLSAKDNPIGKVIRKLSGSE